MQPTGPITEHSVAGCRAGGTRIRLLPPLLPQLLPQLLLGLVLLTASLVALADDLALVGGTVIDVAHADRTARDLHDATVLIHDGRVIALGPRRTVKVPANARRVDVSGRYLVPGLIDGFAGQRSQAQANAHLAMGVTTIIGMSDPRRGLLIMGDPSPHVRALEVVTGEDLSVGTDAADRVAAASGQSRRLTPAEIEATVDTRVWDGYEVLLLFYPLDEEQLHAAVAAARRHHIATIGELGHTSYLAAARAGVNAFVHMSRYSLDLAPDATRRGIADDPFPARDSPLAQENSRYQAALDPDSNAAREYAAALAASGVALMPTTPLYAAGSTFDRHNPWTSPVGPIIDPRDVHLPLDPASGTWLATAQTPSPRLELQRAADEGQMRLQRAFVRAGVPYLAASGTTAFGVLPGDGLHWDLELLTRHGLTPRAALAAATSNYAKVFGWREIGEIAPGRHADIVVLGSDPTVDIRHARDIVDVYLDGQRLDRQALLAAH